VFDLYGAAHALMVGSMVTGVVAVLWLVFRACHNYYISSNELYASRHRRARLLVSAPSFVLMVALFFSGLTWFIGQTRVSRTTVGAIVDQGRTLNEAGLRTEAEVFGTTVSTIVYYRLPVDSPVVNWFNQAAKYLVHEKKDVGVQVAEYGYINFATARSATATIDPGSRTITVELPTPAVRTYIYSVGDVKFSEGPLNAIGTMVKAPFAAMLGKPIVSVNISGELQAAQRAVDGRGNQGEIFGCGKNEIEQQLTGIFDSLPQYRGWPVVVQFPGMRSVPEGRCQALQNQFVHST
jgi:hypothetical protein